MNEENQFDPSQYANEVNEVRARYRMGLIAEWEMNVEIQALTAWYLQEEFVA